ncbi:Gametogenetin-binding protein 2 [Armadillidium nasatum]|uniref:Gametogenetin-binding protein 2 n=1 Tax=Armadillidium nasatum TaxID=96803 RepID=A0A5N5SXA1_9CRUS|nr:Gametogenetin-binding protein 2 [Armadillidium nasatum]
MAKIINVVDISEKLSLSCQQLALPVDDEKVMILQLSKGCNYCKGMEKRERRHFEETFSKQFRKLSREEVIETFRIPSKILFSQLSQVVRCVGCRRSCENLFSHLKETGDPSMEPFFVTNNGTLTLFLDYPLKPNILSNLFSSHE